MFSPTSPDAANIGGKFSDIIADFVLTQNIVVVTYIHERFVSIQWYCTVYKALQIFTDWFGYIVFNVHWCMIYALDRNLGSNNYVNHIAYHKMGCLFGIRQSAKFMSVIDQSDSIKFGTISHKPVCSREMMRCAMSFYMPKIVFEIIKTLKNKHANLISACAEMTKILSRIPKSSYSLYVPVYTH